MSIEFTPESDIGKALVSFWNSLDDNRGARAELRRCDTVNEVVMTATFQRFCQQSLRPILKNEKQWEDRMAAIIGLISHLPGTAVNDILAKAGAGDYTSLLAKQMTDKVSGDRPVVSELRCRRLLQRDRDELYPTLIRIIRLLNGKASLFGIASSVYYWGDGVKKRWAYAYFPNVPAKKSA